MFSCQMKCVWVSPYYLIDVPLKEGFKLTVRIPDEYQEMMEENRREHNRNVYGVEGDKPYIRIFDQNNIDVTEVFLKKVDRTKDVIPTSKNLWTIIDVVHSTLNLMEGGSY